MARPRFFAGAFAIVVGFFVYEYGFFLTLNLSDVLSSWSMSLSPWLGPIEVIGAVLQLVGGTIAIAGLLLCISWVGSQGRGKPIPASLQMEPPRKANVVAQTRQCKFCGAAMEASALFCPKCQRSQV